MSAALWGWVGWWGERAHVDDRLVAQRLEAPVQACDVASRLHAGVDVARPARNDLGVDWRGSTQQERRVVRVRRVVPLETIVLLLQAREVLHQEVERVGHGDAVELEHRDDLDSHSNDDAQSS